MKKSQSNAIVKPVSEARLRFTSKLCELWQDKRHWSVRAILSALCAFAFAFTFLFFGPLEIYVQNQQYLTFSFTALLKAMSFMGIVVFLVIFLILFLLRGKIFNYALSLTFGITLCGYLQRNILNIDHGSLDGTAIAWNTMAVPMVLNLLIWLVIIAVVLTLLFFSRKIWAYAVQILCVFLIGAQGIALFSFVGTEFNIKDNSPYINNAGIYNVTTGENVVFFLLDRMDERYIRKIIDENPEWKTNELSDFTYYDNFTGSYTRTMPSVAYLLTGVRCNYDIPFEDYFRKAWTTSTFLTDIRDAGYKTRVYSELAYVFGNAEYVDGRIDNISFGKNSINYGQLYENMLNLSAYSYAPEALKPFFWLYTGDLSSINDKAHRTHDGEFWQGYRDNGGITIEDAKGQFTFYHMGGAHDPHTLDANGYPKDPSSQDEQLTGNMRMIFNYIEQLKEKGQYDNTTIIISADHGMTGSLAQLDQQRVLGLLIKPANAGENSEMKVSSKQICQDNLRASIISYFDGISDETVAKYGRTIEDI
ncbi:MAG: sulfatase-like hydrolase/transferase, partial [Clostridia bacterium]|nr:sulfatase-like hydrolase/transferase [Clostridia bacterium]